MDNYLKGIIKEIKEHKNKPQETINETIIKKIRDICQEHLDNTEIDNISLCEDSHDHYLLAKVDMAKEILKEIKQHEDKIKETTSKKTFQIVIHNPNQVDMNNNILDDKSKVFEEYKDFKSRSEAKQWLLDYVEIIEMTG